MTRLSSSSPVTAATTSASARPTSARAGISQASPSYQCTPAGSPPRRARATTSRSLSMIVTSWPSSWSCSAMNRPTLPPPAMITRISGPRWRGGVEGGVEVGDGLDGARLRTAGRPPGRPCSPSARARRRAGRGRRRGCSSPPRARSRRRPIHGLVTCRSTMHTLAVGSVHSASVGSGSSRRITWSVVQATVATVAKPSRW